jgi:hypothetical protein
MAHVNAVLVGMENYVIYPHAWMALQSHVSMVCVLLNQLTPNGVTAMRAGLAPYAALK